MRISTITIAYANHHVFDAALRAYERTADLDLVTDHTIVDNHYPLHRDQLLNVAQRWAHTLPGGRILDPSKNLGLHHGFNYAMRELALEDEDFVIGYDPDECPITQGWVRAMLAVMTAAPRVGWLSLTSPHTDLDQRDFPFIDKTIAGKRVRFFHQAKMNIVCMWRVGALRECGWLDEYRPYYGFLESAMWPKLTAHNWSTGYMMDYRVDPTRLGDVRPDEEYQLYKRAHVADGARAFMGSFDEWLAQQSKVR